MDWKYRLIHKHNEKVTVKAVHYSKDEKFWLGYSCRKCGLRFGSIGEMQKHSKIHRRLKKKPCENCKTKTYLQTHHISYSPEITQELCPQCHGQWHAENTPNWGKKGCTNFMH